MYLLTKIKSKPIIAAIIILTCLGTILASLLYLLTNQPNDESTHASPLNPPKPPSSPQARGPQEFRGVWIATVQNIDWPSRPGLSPIAQQQEFTHLLDQVTQMRMNAVIVQIKPAADAFYPSHFGPWSAYLTGTQGKDPGYNPLAFMIAEAHKRHLEFHGWFNPYRISLTPNLNQLAPNHPARQHPDWIVSYGGKLYYNPGIPAAREFIINSILEAVSNYNLDEVHMEDYFYPYPIAGQDFPDASAFQQFNPNHLANKADWRRDNVNQLIHELSTRIKRLKPHVKLGISPFGVWRNKATDPTGSDTRAGIQNYDDLYADTRTWIKNNWLDYIAPQIYWPIGYAPAAYEKLVAWWSKEVAGHNIHLYIGQAAYQIGSATPAAWANPQEMPNHLQLDRRTPQIKGSIFFSLKPLLQNPLNFKTRLITDLYKQPATIPLMPWLS